MKKMCPPSYHRNSFVATHALGTVHHVPKGMSCHKAFVVVTRKAHCFHDNIYIYIYVDIYIYIYIYIYTYHENNMYVEISDGNNKQQIY